MSRQVHRVILAAATASAAALALAASPAAIAQPAPAARAAAAQSAVNYVALGDSYSAGVGSGGYISSSGSCSRSSLAYSALWSAAHNPQSYVSVACGGATIGSAESTQLSALSASTTLVSITIGGNDVDFMSTMETCSLLFFLSGPCTDAVTRAESIIVNDLPGELDTLLAQIKAKGPHATVIVLGYPDFYDLSESCAVLTASDRAIIDQAIGLTDGVLQTAAAKYGDVFADARPGFTGHEVCDQASWINTFDVLAPGSSYHPVAAGQSGGFLPVFTAAVSSAAAAAVRKSAG